MCVGFVKNLSLVVKQLGVQIEKLKSTFSSSLNIACVVNIGEYGTR